VALLFALQGRKVTVELRNDVLVTGVLAEVDDYMNMYIDSAVWTPVWGPTQVCHALSTGHTTLLLLDRLLYQQCATANVRQQLLHPTSFEFYFMLPCCILLLLR
jgi:small nuclear ribonucleoprotein (snRNP)-like protein